MKTNLVISGLGLLLLTGCAVSKQTPSSVVPPPPAPSLIATMEPAMESVLRSESAVAAVPTGRTLTLAWDHRNLYPVRIYSRANTNAQWQLVADAGNNSNVVVQGVVFPVQFDAREYMVTGEEAAPSETNKFLKITGEQETVRVEATDQMTPSLAPANWTAIGPSRLILLKTNATIGEGHFRSKLTITRNHTYLIEP